MIRLFELRNEYGLTQRQAAAIFNISQGTYNNWEQGNTEPSIEQIIKIAEYFDVTCDYLLDRNKESHSMQETENDIRKVIRMYSSLPQESRTALLTILEQMNNK